jgi:hypothetical protein
MLQHVAVSLLVAGIIAPFSWWLGTMARSLNLPAISGFLLSGIICGGAPSRRKGPPSARACMPGPNCRVGRPP